MKAILLLEDGTVFEGTGFGAKGHKCGEVVFNTSMTGYQEILTDPSYYEQIMTMTYPLIGNYGTTSEDVESRACFVSGFIVKENCDYPSSWRSQKSLDQYLRDNNVVGLEGIDTRKLVRHIREKGAMRGIISSDILEIAQLQAKLDEYPGLVNRDIVKDVVQKTPYDWDKTVLDILEEGLVDNPPEYNVVAIDCGIKENILRLLVAAGCKIKVVPSDTSAKDILAMKPDGVFLSNGPGDPEPVSYVIDTIKALLGKVPIFGICLGHQLLSLALGAKTYKLKFGHRGGNHPVKDLRTGKIEVTSQNHGFSAVEDSFDGLDVEITHINLNDQTIEGIRCTKVPAFSVQYHPEASPGPHDSRYLFAEFTDLMKEFKK